MSDLNTSGSSSSGKVHLTYINRKGGTILLHGGYEYIIKRKHKSGLIIWECTNRKKNKCKGLIKIKVSPNNNTIVGISHLI